MLFTPRSKKIGERIAMQIKKVDIPRGVVKKFYVEELVTGKVYKCRSAACSLPGCICDAIIYDEE
jgi:hypothetical protein